MYSTWIVYVKMEGRQCRGSGA